VIAALVPALRVIQAGGGVEMVATAIAEALSAVPGIGGARIDLPGRAPVERGRIDRETRLDLPACGGTFALGCTFDDTAAASALVDGLLAFAIAQEERESQEIATRRVLVHDLRGLVAVVLGHCEMLESGLSGDLNPRQRKSVEAIRRQVERAQAILDEVRRRPS
jgi:signal transduction histidine kinase